MADDSIAGLPLISRKEAIANGAKWYFTGNPCHNGHIAARLTSNRACAVCTSHIGAAWRATRRTRRLRTADDCGPDCAPGKQVNSRQYYRQVCKEHGQPKCIQCKRAHRREYSGRYFSDPVTRAKKNEYYRLRAKTPKAAQSRRDHRERVRVSLAGRPKPDCCEVCGRPEKLHFDHCHLTGRFRGWICSDCNIAVGRMRENPVALHRLADYIDRHNAQFRQGDWVAATEILSVLKNGHKRRQ